MPRRYYSQTPEAHAVLQAWTRFRSGRGDFTFHQAERLFVDVPDRRDWALILDGLPGAEAVIDRLSDAMNRCDVTPSGLLLPHASGRISEAAALSFAWAMVARWQAVADALTKPRDVYAAPPIEARLSDMFHVRYMEGEAYSYDFEVLDALYRQNRTPPPLAVPKDIWQRLKRAIRGAGDWEVARYVLHPMIPYAVDVTPQFELFLGGYEMAFATDERVLVAPFEPDPKDV